MSTVAPPLTIAEAAQHTRAAVLAGEWSQGMGTFDPGGPCCVRAGDLRSADLEGAITEVEGRK